MTLEKIDLFKQHRQAYKASKKPFLLHLEPVQYLAIDGKGEPGGAAFVDAVAAMYAMAYTVKMTRKADGLQDYVICKLEALWRTPASDLSQVPPSEWCWQLLIRTPDFVAESELTRAAEALISKGKPEKVREVTLTTLSEGKCVQMLHLGPYDKEPETLKHMQDFAETQQLGLSGSFHEIYLSDPRRVEPERLKTILRHPVSPKES